MTNGERRCPNKNASLSEKLALISDPRYSEDKKKTEVPHQIAALSVEDDTDEQDAKAFEELGEEEKEAVEWMIEEYITGLSDIDYPCNSDDLGTVEINAIKLEADTSYPRRVVVPMNLRSSSLIVQVMAFLDIGSMSNFMDDRFARRHGLQLKKKEVLLKCEGYDGSAGSDVEWE